MYEVKAYDTAGHLVAEGEGPTQSQAQLRVIEPLKAGVWYSLQIVRKASPMDKLTLTEGRVLELLAKGMNVREISRARAVTEVTTRYQIRRILEKFRVNSQLKAVVIYYEYHGLKIEENNDG
jgi:DNA-binding NarL/FixJ family response regulator